MLKRRSRLISSVPCFPPLFSTSLLLSSPLSGVFYPFPSFADPSAGSPSTMRAVILLVFSLALAVAEERECDGTVFAYFGDESSSSTEFGLFIAYLLLMIYFFGGVRAISLFHPHPCPCRLFSPLSAFETPPLFSMSMLTSAALQVSVTADMFMNSIEMVTSVTKMVRIDRNSDSPDARVQVRVWNETVCHIITCSITCYHLSSTSCHHSIACG